MCGSCSSSTNHGVSCSTPASPVHILKCSWAGHGTLISPDSQASSLHRSFSKVRSENKVKVIHLCLGSVCGINGNCPPKKNDRMSHIKSKTAYVCVDSTDKAAIGLVILVHGGKGEAVWQCCIMDLTCKVLGKHVEFLHGQHLTPFCTGLSSPPPPPYFSITTAASPPHPAVHRGKHPPLSLPTYSSIPQFNLCPPNHISVHHSLPFLFKRAFFFLLWQSKRQSALEADSKPVR